MVGDDLIVNGDECLIGTVAAANPGFLAHSADPLVRAGRRVTGAVLFLVLPSLREYVRATAKERPEQADLLNPGARSPRVARYREAKLRASI
jgi:hypothetical protein